MMRYFERCDLYLALPSFLPICCLSGSANRARSSGVYHYRARELIDPNAANLFTVNVWHMSTG